MCINKFPFHIPPIFIRNHQSWLRIIFTTSFSITSSALSYGNPPILLSGGHHKGFPPPPPPTKPAPHEDDSDFLPLKSWKESEKEKLLSPIEIDSSALFILRLSKILLKNAFEKISTSATEIHIYPSAPNVAVMTNKGLRLHYLRQMADGRFNSYLGYLRKNGEIANEKEEIVVDQTGEIVQKEQLFPTLVQPENPTEAEEEEEEGRKYLIAHHQGNFFIISPNIDSGHIGVVLGQAVYLVGSITFRNLGQKQQEKGLQVHSFYNDSGTFKPTDEAIHIYLARSPLSKSPYFFASYAGAKKIEIKP